jgi:Protein of unknown function (DUF3611)
MLQTLRRIWRPSISDSLANAFSRLGWIGFWIQVAIGRIPLTLIVYAFIFGRNAGAGTRGGLLLVGYLTIAGFLVLVFTTIWSYKYTRLAERIADSTQRPSVFLVQQAAWRSSVKCAGHLVFDADNFIRGRAAPDLFPPCASGRNTRDSDNWRRPSKLGIRCRHDESNGPSSNHIR